MNYAIRLQLVQTGTPTKTFYIAPNKELTEVKEEAQTFASTQDALSAEVDTRNAANSQRFGDGWGVGVIPVVSTVRVGKNAAAHSFFTKLAIIAFVFATPIVFIAAPLMVVDDATGGAFSRSSGSDRGDRGGPYVPFD